MTPITAKKIDVLVSYGTGPDGMGPGETQVFSGHRVSVSCTAAGGAGMGSIQVRMYGMKLELMNRLSTVGKLPLAVRRNVITVLAGDDSKGMSQIFQGTIQTAWADMMGAPDVAFNFTALAGLIEALQPILPSSYPSSVDAAVVMASLADKAGLAFENNGVSVTLPKSYWPGSARAQMAAIARAGDFDWVIDNGKLAIWPKGGSRGGLIPLISPETGMVGYPTYTPVGIIVTTQFAPSVRYGARVEVKSSLKPACGTWKVVTLIHDVEALVPNGKWFTQMQLAPPDYVPVV